MTIAERELREPGKTSRVNESVMPVSPGKRALTDAFSSDPGGHGGLMTTGDLAGQLQGERDARQPTSNIKFRAPKPTDIASILAAGKVPEAKLKDSIKLALTRMAKESQLKTKDPIADVMARIFPSAGKFDQKEFEKVVDVKDRDKIYKTVVDAETKVSATDKPKLKAVMDDAIKLVDNAMANTAGLKEVFGTKHAAAKAVYGKAKTAIATVKTNMDTAIDTDYNRDDEQVGLGGWADFGSQHIHLERSVAEVHDPNAAKITIIHECCHLAKGTVDDHGYYGSDGFEAMTEDEKVNNAAHYEELPARELGTSLYAGVTFTPGVKKGGGKVTFEDEVRREASEYLRKAWDKAVDVHSFLRSIRREIEGGNPGVFAAKKTRILEISKLEKLTIHDQTTPSTINMNDIVLSEGAAHAMTIIQSAAEKQSVPAAAVAPKVKADYVQDVIDGSIKSYGALTGNDGDDKKLVDWLVKEYRKPL
jgi:hypothetical protein